MLRLKYNKILFKYSHKDFDQVASLNIDQSKARSILNTQSKI